LTHRGSDTQPASDQASATIALVTKPGSDLLVKKTVSDPNTVRLAGSVLTYTITFTNTGTSPAAVDHIDDLSRVLDDATLGDVDASYGLSATVYADNSLIITGQVNPGSVATVMYYVTVKADGHHGDSSLFNSVVSADTPAGEWPTPQTPPDQCPNCLTTPVAGLTLSATATTGAANQPGDQVVIEFSLTNDGVVGLTGLQLTDVTSTGTGSFSGLACPVTSLDAGASTPCQVTYTLRAADPLLDQVVVSARATGSFSGQSVSSAVTTARLPLASPSDIGTDVYTLPHRASRPLWYSCTVQALRVCTGRTAHRGCKGIAVLYRH
jgi:hypothetical protein